MSIVIVFIVQLAVPLLFGLIATLYLRGVTRRLLIDLCGTEDRADFWVKSLAIGMTVAPLVVVLVFAGSPQACSVSDPACATRMLRESMAFSLMTVLLVVGCTAATIRRAVPRDCPPALAAEKA